MSGAGSSGTNADGDLDWDLVPIMLILSTSYVTIEIIGYLIFDFGRELNTKIYNESLKLRGKSFFNTFKIITEGSQGIS